MSRKSLSVPSEGIDLEFCFTGGSSLESSFKALAARIKAYENSLDEFHQLGIVVSGFPNAGPINLSFLQLQKPSTLSLCGEDANDRKVDLSINIKDGCHLVLNIRKIHIPYGWSEVALHFRPTSALADFKSGDSTKIGQVIRSLRCF